ncbi:MAG: shikimate kinase [Eubacteriales bacterium]|nr:shikimate kinase [Eubacteriales bacterium]
MKSNVTLIGMPGVGKSTVGVILAKELGYSFIDSDLLIQSREQKLLHEIMDEVGVEGFLKIEEDVNASITAERTVIATGGSVVYGEKAMNHLKEISNVVYLKLPHDQLMHRLDDLHDRGVVLKPGQTLEDIFNERSVLYEKYADIIVDESELDIEATLHRIELELLRRYNAVL